MNTGNFNDYLRVLPSQNDTRETTLSLRHLAPSISSRLTGKPAGENSNMNSFPATQAGQVTEITVTEKGESTITIVNSSGVTTSQTLSAGLQLLVKQGSDQR